MVLRYCPLEGAGGAGGAEGPQGGDGVQHAVAAWGAALDAQLHVLHATVALRQTFQARVLHHACLKLLHVPGWAGQTILILILLFLTLSI